MHSAQWQPETIRLIQDAHVPGPQLRDHFLIQAIIKSISQLNVAVGDLISGFSAHHSMFGDVHSRLVRPIDITTCKGTGQATLQLRAEMEDLKARLSTFDGEVTRVVNSIDHKFGEVSFTDDTVKQAIERVVTESRAKFDETGSMGARFESVVEGVMELDRKCHLV